jgi:hypothetical protein
MKSWAPFKLEKKWKTLWKSLQQQNKNTVSGVWLVKSVEINNGYLHLQTEKALAYVTDLSRTGTLFERISYLIEQDANGRLNSSVTDETLNKLIAAITSGNSGGNGVLNLVPPIVHEVEPETVIRTEEAVLEVVTTDRKQRSAKDLLEGMEGMLEF